MAVMSAASMAPAIASAPSIPISIISPSCNNEIRGNMGDVMQWEVTRIRVNKACKVTIDPFINLI